MERKWGQGYVADFRPHPGPSNSACSDRQSLKKESSAHFASFSTLQGYLKCLLSLIHAFLLSDSCLHRLRTQRLSFQLNVSRDQGHLFFWLPLPCALFCLQLTQDQAKGYDSELSYITHMTGLNVGLCRQPVCPYWAAVWPCRRYWTPLGRSGPICPMGDINSPPLIEASWGWD